MKKKEIKVSQIVAWIDPTSESSGMFTVIKKYAEHVLLKNSASEIEAPYHELQLLEDTYCCPSCGNIDIEEQGWFYVNNPNTVINDMVEESPIWCSMCDFTLSSSTNCDEFLKIKMQ
jgi:hypothetical protein